MINSRWGVDSKWLALMAVGMGTLIIVANVGMVSIALPSITSTLRSELGAASWIQLAYQITVTGLLLGLGRLADEMGRKRMYVWGFVLFSLGSLAAAWANDLIPLVFSRILQAIGAAMTIANNRSILTIVFPVRERGRALSVMQVASGAGTVLALAIGGIVVAAWGWTSIFWILFIFGLLGTGMAHWFLEEHEKKRPEGGFNWLAGLFLFGLIGTVFWGMSQLGSPEQNPQKVMWIFFGASVCGAGFYWRERSSARPWIEWSLFSEKEFAWGVGASFLSQTVRSAILFLLPFQFERVFHFASSQAGLVLLILPLAEIFLAPLSGWWSDRSGSRYPTSLGMLLVGVGLYLLAGYFGEVSEILLLPSIGLIGIGLGLFHSANNSAVMGATPAGQLSAAAGLLATNITLGMTAGVVLNSAILSARLPIYAAAGQDTMAFQKAAGEVYLILIVLAVLGLVVSLHMNQSIKRSI